MKDKIKAQIKAQQAQHGQEWESSLLCGLLGELLLASHIKARGGLVKRPQQEFVTGYDLVANNNQIIDVKLCKAKYHIKKYDGNIFLEYRSSPTNISGWAKEKEVDGFDYWLAFLDINDDFRAHLFDVRALKKSLRGRRVDTKGGTQAQGWIINSRDSTFSCDLQQDHVWLSSQINNVTKGLRNEI